MDIQIPNTPQKPNRDAYLTPPHSSQRRVQGTPVAQRQEYQTPPRKKVLFETPTKTPGRNQDSAIKGVVFASGIKLKENPQSKRHKRSAYQMKEESPMKCEEEEEVQVSPFSLSRLEQDYSLVHYLGNGHFSDVGLYKSRLSGQLFAIKTAKANRMSVNEVQALGSLWVLSGQCPNIVRYYHSWIEEGQLFLVMEYCQNTLQQQISNHRLSGEPLKEKTIVSYLRAALLGLASIHRQGILHLDVKPQNLLFKGNTLKIADFGLSRAAKVRNGDIEEGDSRYLARQILNVDPFVDLTKADIFSLAITTYEMLTLEILPNNGPDWMRVREMGIQVAGRMDLTNYSDRLLLLVERMGAASWQNRPSAAQILQSPLFRQSTRMANIFSNKSGKKREQSSL